jgi:hypothetical protein
MWPIGRECIRLVWIELTEDDVNTTPEVLPE